MKLISALLTLLFLNSCQDVLEEKERANPYDKFANIKLSIGIANPDSLLTFEYGDPIKYKSQQLMGSNGKVYNHLIEKITWEVDSRKIETKEMTTTDSIKKLGNFPLKLTVLLTNGKKLTDSKTLKIIPLTTQLEILSNASNPAEYFDQKAFSFQLKRINSNEDVPWQSLKWISNIDGLISEAAQFSTNKLSANTHTISLEVIKEDGVLKTQTFNLVVKPINLDNLSFDLPSDTVNAFGTELNYTAHILLNGASIELDSVSWSSDLDGRLSNTDAFSSTRLRAGLHTLTLKYIAEDKLVREKIFKQRILPIPYSFEILSPDTNTLYEYDQTINFNPSFKNNGEELDLNTISWTMLSSGDILSEEKSFSYINDEYAGKHRIKVEFEMADKVKHDTLITFNSSFPGMITHAYDAYLSTFNFYFRRIAGQTKLFTSKNTSMDLVSSLTPATQTAYPTFSSGYDYSIADLKTHLIISSNQIYANYRSPNIRPKIALSTLVGTKLREIFPAQDLNPQIYLGNHVLSSASIDLINNRQIFMMTSNYYSALNPTVLLCVDFDGNYLWYASLRKGSPGYYRTSPTTYHVTDEEGNSYVIYLQYITKINNKGSVVSVKTFSHSFSNHVMRYYKGNIFTFDQNSTILTKVDTTLSDIKTTVLSTPLAINSLKIDDSEVVLRGSEFVTLDLNSLAEKFVVQRSVIDDLILSDNSRILLGQSKLTKIDANGTILWETPSFEKHVLFSFLYEMGSYYRLVGKLRSSNKIYYLDVSLDGEILNAHQRDE